MLHFPNQFWVTQQVLNALPGENPYKHLIVDNDDRFSGYLAKEIENLLGINVVKTSVASPWQNAVVERVIGTIRRECLDHHIILGEEHLRTLLAEFTEYYNSDRTHRSLQKDAPEARDKENSKSPNENLHRIVRLGGLHSRYTWENPSSSRHRNSSYNQR